MSHHYLGREEAPIAESTWNTIDNVVTETAKSILSGRKLLGIEGPFGFGLKAVPLSDNEKGGFGISGMLPLVSVTGSFTLGKRDIAAFERDNLPQNWEKVAMAAIQCAKEEDTIIFKGAGQVQGLLNTKGSGSVSLSSWNTIGKAADDLIKAVTHLDGEGFHGPYSLALAPARYNLLLRRYPQGGTELEHLQAIVGDGVTKTPVLEDGGVLIASGKQYGSIVIGQDLKTGYIGPTLDSLEFSLTESLALMIRAPKMICVLK
ncbi:MAG TPA: family 1 encapsulin nanocompartment shell protein [Methanoregulaceae archaeon]|nr:family 1 encapsulin nanocompartment shell protein [Methanoregulaceae archaeon]